MKTKTLLVAGLVLALMVGLLGSAGLAAAPPEKADFLIGFHGAPGPAEQALVRGLGGEIYRQFTIVNVVAAHMTPRAAEALARSPRVAYVEPDFLMYALQQQVPWGIDRVFGDEKYLFPTWGTSTGVGIGVAVLDTGIDATHEDLKVAGGINTMDGADSGAWADGHGHGTHVAGTIAAVDNIVGVVGVAPAVSLYAVKVLSDGGSGSISGIVAGIEWAVNHQEIRVSNMSFGSSTSSQTLKDACDSAYAAGHLLVSSAGNSGNPAGRGDNVGYPAAYSSVIAVAASTSNDTRASYSSTGPAVELIAPGSSILSTLPGNSYGTYSGTSMASPHVAGVAALVWAADPTLSNVELRAILQTTAENLGLPWNHQGYGLVRADLAVREVGEVEPPPPPPPPPASSLSVDVTTSKTSYSLGETVYITATVTDNGSLVGGAAVQVEITTASGRKYTANGTTGSDGKATFSLKTKRPDGTGTYQVTATASKSGYGSGTGSTTFEVT